MSNAGPFFSIIIPTRNESTDILKTLHSIQANTLKDYEVLVVDASQDNTPDIVRKLGDSKIELLPQTNRDGRCGARNQGIRKAKGEVVVILNADVRLPNDFLDHLKKHYNEGADYVIVDSTVENQHHPFGAMIEAEHQFLYRSGRESVNWCEGYSCRRSCATEVGLFPEKHLVPICAGEDAVFGENIAARFRRATDFNMVVSHSVPEDFATFWDQRVGRGEGCTQRHILLEKWSLLQTLGDAMKWTLKSILWIVLIFPWLRYARILHNHLPKTSTPKFFTPLLLSRIAHEVGRWKGFRRIWRS